MKKSLSILFVILCLFCSCSKAEDIYIKIERKHLIKSFECEGGEGTILVDANVDFNYECNADWIEVKKNGPSIKFTVEPLRDCPDRNTTLKVTGEGAEPVEISVIQKAVTVKNSPESFTVTNYNPTMAITIRSGVELEFTLPDWVEVTDGIFEYGEKTYTFSALPITNGAETRSGEFIVRSRDSEVGFELNIPIEQSSNINEAMKKLRELWATDPMGDMKASKNDPRYALLAQMEEYSNLFNRDPFQKYLTESPENAYKTELDNPIMSCYRYAFDVVLSEVQSTIPEEGTAVIWMLYNMGFIVKTPSICIGIDINHYYAKEFAPYIDVLMVSHADSDHKDEQLMTAMCELGKPVLSNFWTKSSQYVSTSPTKYDIGSIKVYTSITDHDATKLNYTTCHFIQFGQDAGNFSFMHVGDSRFKASQYTEMTGRDPDLLILRYANPEESNILGDGTGKVNPRYIFLSHLIELRHYIEKSPMRATILGAWDNNLKNLSGKAHMPFWGEKFLWKDGTLTTLYR